MSAAPEASTIATRPPAWSGRTKPPAIAGMAALTMPGTPSLRLPGEHFAAALVFLLVGSAGLVWIAPELSAGLYLSPRVAGVTHCFTLGWLTMTIFGAIYQLLPVALGVPIRSERAGHLSFWMFAPGVALFASGVAFLIPVLRYSGITLITAGIICLGVNAGMSLARITDRGVIWAGMIVAFSFLIVTLLAGGTLAANMSGGFLGESRNRLLAAHLHVALLGWVLIMIVIISHRLLPMFLLAHTASTVWTRRALVSLAAGVVALACGLAAPHHALRPWLSWCGVGLVEGGVILFLVQATLFFRARKRPRLDAGLRHAVAALVLLATAAALGPLVLAAGVTHRHLGTAYVLLGVLGGFSLYVVGQFYKIVPFLVWMARFRNDMGKKRVPMVAQLYSPALAHTDLVLFVIGIISMVGGIAIGAAPLVRAGAIAFTVAAGIVISQMIHVAFGAPFESAGATPAIPPAIRI